MQSESKERGNKVRSETGQQTNASRTAGQVKQITELVKFKVIG